jgi:hypothetical protein
MLYRHTTHSMSAIFSNRVIRTFVGKSTRQKIQSDNTLDNSFRTTLLFRTTLTFRTLLTFRTTDTLHSGHLLHSGHQDILHSGHPLHSGHLTFRTPLTFRTSYIQDTPYIQDNSDNSYNQDTSYIQDNSYSGHLLHTIRTPLTFMTTLIFCISDTSYPQDIVQCRVVHCPWTTPAIRTAFHCSILSAPLWAQWKVNTQWTYCCRWQTFQRELP